jgi:tripartite-type tricarboxylate transporter receptor subunit TctC
LLAALFVSLGAHVAPQASAQSYPAKPIRIVDAFAPGGTTDILARLIAQKMTDSWGQQVIVENKPGANGIIGTEYVVKAPADGYTLFVGSTSTLAVNQSLYKLSFDPVRDLAPLGMLASQPLIIVVHPSVPASSVKELVQLAKARPNELNYASPGIGNPLHLAGELFKTVTGTRMTHVPYNRGSAAALPDVIGGQVQLMFAPMLPVQPHIKSGKLRAIAVTGPQRSAIARDIPTVAESGFPNYVVTIWNAAMVPAGTPREVITKLNAEITRILKLPDIRERLTAGGVEPVTSTPEEQGGFTKAEIEKWAKVIRDSGTKVE